MRDPGWHMIGAGRYLERSLQVCHLLAGHHHRPSRHRRRPRGAQRGAHRLRERGHPPAPLPRLRPARPASSSCCCLDPDNPRSLVFCLGELRTPPGRAAGVHRLDPAGAAARATSTTSSRAPTSPTLVAIGGVGRPNLEAYLAATAGHPDPAGRGGRTSSTSPPARRRVRWRRWSSPRSRGPHDGVPDHPPHDVLLRRRGHRLARHRAPGAARAAVAVGGVVRRRGDARPRRPEPRHGLLRQLRDVLPGDRAAHPPGDRGGQRGRRHRRRSVPDAVLLQAAWEPARPLVSPDDRGRLAGDGLRPALGLGRAGRGGARRTPRRRSAGTGRSARRSPT